MYTLTSKPSKTRTKINKAYEGERIEEKMDRIVNNNEPISDGAPLIYTERKDGVMPEYDIRADKWDIAIEAMDKVAVSNQMRREKSLGERSYEKMSPDEKEKFNTKFPDNKHNTGGESIQGTK